MFSVIWDEQRVLALVSFLVLSVGMGATFILMEPGAPTVDWLGWLSGAITGAGVTLTFVATLGSSS